MDKLLNVSSSPHVRDKSSTKSIMRDVVIALLPATLFGVFNFGVRALVVILTTCASAVLAEYVWQKCMKQNVTTSDYSALLTGLLLALNLPVAMYRHLWMCVLGGVFAVIIVKQLFGGLGQNFMNPALGARCFLMLSFSSIMTNSFAVPKGNVIMGGYQAHLANTATDALAGATPLMQVKEAAGMSDLAAGGVTLKDMFLGTTWGTIGETSVLAILIGGIYLLARKIIDWKIPVIYILTFVVFNFIYAFAAKDVYVPIFFEVCGGGLMLGAFFMATDYVTSPITDRGKIIYAVLLGLLTALFRFFGESAEGVSFAIIIGNLCVPLIERYTIPKAFGKEGKVNE